ncbi:hypothetical protein CR62_01910 [Serratia grimesii]|uniref:Uncharacterized protein n=1 Tax=Serratia grimesii TaxID=82995 RepID=A0ABR4UFA9_9GAMM|nr:hypothetical protein CR62_01910 [Serratia grimesii]
MNVVIILVGTAAFTQLTEQPPCGLCDKSDDRVEGGVWEQWTNWELSDNSKKTALLLLLDEYN